VKGSPESGVGVFWDCGKFDAIQQTAVQLAWAESPEKKGRGKEEIGLRIEERRGRKISLKQRSIKKKQDGPKKKNRPMR